MRRQVVYVVLKAYGTKVKDLSRKGYGPVGEWKEFRNEVTE